MIRYIISKLHSCMLRHKEIPFPSTSLGMIFFLTLVIMAWLIYSTWNLHNFVDESSVIHSERIALNNDLLYTDQIRTLSALALIYGEAPSLQQKYREESTLFFSILEKLNQLVDFSNHQIIGSLQQSHDAMLQIEKEAIEIGINSQARALSLLAGPEYKNLKEQYRRNIYELNREVTKESSAEIEEQKNILQRSILLLIATITALLLSWLVLLRALKRLRQIILEFKDKTIQAAEGRNIAEGKAAAQISSLHTVLDHLPIAVFAKEVTNDLRFVLWNSKAEEVFGIKREDVLDKTDSELFLKQNEAGRSRAIDHQIIKSGKVFQSNEKITAKQKTISLHVVRAPIFDNNGQTKLILGYVENVSSQSRPSEMQ